MTLKHDSAGSSTDVPDAGTLVPTTAALSIDELWKRWEERRDLPTRNQLAQHYFPLVKHVTRQMAATLSSRADVDDLEGYGAEGLLDAIERFSISRGVQFSTFAAYRIRGAIYDGIRANDWVPRSVRRREREVKANTAWLSARFGREPSESEEASSLGVTLGVMRSIKDQIVQAGVTSIHAGHMSEDGREEVEIPDRTAGPLEVFLSQEMTEALAEAVARLTEREQIVVALSFNEGKTLAEIGRLFDVSESRVSQIRSGALRSLRNYLDAKGLVPAS